MLDEHDPDVWLPPPISALVFLKQSSLEAIGVLLHDNRLVSSQLISVQASLAPRTMLFKKRDRCGTGCKNCVNKRTGELMKTERELFGRRVWKSRRVNSDADL